MIWGVIMLATSINMHRSTFLAVSRAAARLSTTRRSVVVRLLMRVMRDIDRHQGGFATISYQPEDPKGEWHCFSIRFRPDENGFFHDLRNTCKCSVSFLVAIAAEKYLDELLNENRGYVNKNIWFRNYVIHREVNDGLICWQIYWGYSKKHLRNLLE
jgi:hypothetical protein